MIGPYNLIITEAALLNSSDIFGILDPDSGGAKTFSVMLSPSGQANATHWGCSTLLEESTVEALQNMSVTEFKDFVNSIATQRGRNQISSAIAFKNNLQMDNTMDFWSFVESIGLKPVATEGV
jgi:hypothetical protein